MLHACVQRFDVMGTVENFLGTKHPKKFKTRVAAVTHMSISCFIIITLMYIEKHLNIEHDSWLSSAGILFAKQPQPNQPQLGRSSPQAERAVNTCTTAAVRSLTTIR